MSVSPVLSIQVAPLEVWDGVSKMANEMRFIVPDYANQPGSGTYYVFEYDTTTNSSATPYPLFANDDDAIAFFGPTAGTALVSYMNTQIGATFYTSYTISKIDPFVAAALTSFVPTATTVNGHALTGNVTVGYGDLTGTPSFSAVATSGSYTDLSSKPSIPAAQVQSDWNAVSGLGVIANKPTIPTVNTPSFAYPTRSLNTAFQISTTQNTIVSYSVDIACTISLTTGQTGTVTLQYADDSGMSTNLKTVCSTANANTGSLTIGLNLTQTSTGTLSGMIPSGKYVKIVTANTTGTPTFTMRTSQEVLI